MQRFVIVLSMMSLTTGCAIDPSTRATQRPISTAARAERTALTSGKRTWSFFRKPVTWCFVIDRTLAEDIQVSVAQRVVQFQRRRLIGVSDYVGIVALGRAGELVYDGEARYLPEARGIAEQLAHSSGLEGSNIVAGLEVACRFLAGHVGPKRLVIVSDLVVDPYKIGSEVREAYSPVESFNWAAHLADLALTEITIFGVPEPVRVQHHDWLNELAAHCARLQVFDPGHRLTYRDFGGASD